MRKNQKIITTILWSFLVLTMVAVVGRGMWRTQDDPAARGVSASTVAPTGSGGLPVLYDAPHFALTDQDAKPFSADQLKGTVWVADFVFTNCPGVCPLMTQQMVKLQDAIPKEVKFVSFSVDPERDTPEALKQYATKRYHVDESRWRFLTGSASAMKDVAAGMKVTALPAEGDRPIQHDEHFLLVDHQGHVRGVYHSKDDEEMAQLAKDARQLISAKD